MWLIYAVMGALIWGLDYTLSERIFKYKISPVTILALQMGIGAIIFAVIAYTTQLKTDIATLSQHKSVLWLVLSIIVTFNVGNLLIFLSIQAKNATLAGIIELCYPLFTILFTWLLFKENHTNLSVIIGGILIASGVIVISVFN